MNRTREFDQDGRSTRTTKSSRSKRSRQSSRRGSDATSLAASEVDTDAESTRSKKSTARSRSNSNRGTPRKSRNESGSEDEGERSGFFQGISNAIRGRRPSTNRIESNESITSRPSSSRSKIRRQARDEEDDDAISTRSESEFGGDDPYGPYGSEDTNSTSSTQSSSSQDDGPRRRTGFLGMPGGGDSVFGESRIDFGEEEEEEGGYLDERERKGVSSNAYQALYIPDEDLPLRLLGLETSIMKIILWRTGCILSAGILWLVGRWLPNVWLKSVGKSGAFEKASYIVIEVGRISSFSNLRADEV